MFSKDGLRCHLKCRKQFFEENMGLSKKVVCCFDSLVLYIFLKQPCIIFDTLLFIVHSFDSEVMPGRLHQTKAKLESQSLKLQSLCLLQAMSSLTFRQLQSVDSLWKVYVTWQEHTVKCTIQISTHNTAQSFDQIG